MMHYSQNESSYNKFARKIKQPTYDIFWILSW